MDKVRAALVPQALVAVTDKVKAVVPVVKDAVIALVPWPDVTEPFADEKDQLYEVMVLS
jgi:hypothetical protein